jgi:3-oxoacyl-[acyl-carrier protein] reductase
MRVAGKVAIVTGAAQGIGHCYAEALAREGAKVVLADIKAEAAEANAEQLRAAGHEALALEVDVASPESLKLMATRTVERFGGIDVLVNNAAIYEGLVDYKLMDLPVEYWRRVVDVNLTSILCATQAVVPHMKERGKGRIVNQSSAAASMVRDQYGVTKLALQGLTVGFARELGRHGITVNAIAPGVVPTDGTKAHFSDDQLEGMKRSMSSVGRLGTPADMAHALVYLASEESDFVTGQILHVDGGLVMQPA